MPAQIVLQPRRARPFFGRHPWVYAGAIAEIRGSPADGDEVDLVTHSGAFVARGLYNSRSKIRVRLYSWLPDRPLDRDFWRDRLRGAVHLRRAVLQRMQPAQACRIVCSEGDGMSGCTIDRFDRWLVMQFTSLGLAARRELLAELLVEIVNPAGIYLRTERGIGQLEGLELHDGPLAGEVPVGPIAIEEHGLTFLVNIAEGQKTGFYLDQRENRRVVAALAADRRVLDAFCYTGGFGLHAARAGAHSVLGVDASQTALQLARENARVNGLANIAFEAADVFEKLEQLVTLGSKFDLIVLDPPKFARARASVDDALRGYRRLQKLALRLLDADGILVVCCCSGLITEEMLEKLLAQLAASEQRDIQILERRGPAPDHPVSVACPDSHYLKCLITRVR